MLILDSVDESDHNEYNAIQSMQFVPDEQCVNGNKLQSFYSRIRCICKFTFSRKKVVSKYLSLDFYAEVSHEQDD